MRNTITQSSRAAAARLAIDRATAAKRAREIGQATIARHTGLTKMMISRYCSGSGGDDALTHYLVCSATGRPVFSAPPVKPPNTR